MTENTISRKKKEKLLKIPIMYKISGSVKKFSQLHNWKLAKVAQRDAVWHREGNSGKLVSPQVNKVFKQSIKILKYAQENSNHQQTKIISSSNFRVIEATNYANHSAHAINPIL